MNNENYVLNEINKGIKMGMDSISNVSQKVQDDRFKQDLKCQYDKYNQILNNVNDELSNYDDFPKELNAPTGLFFVIRPREVSAIIMV